MRVDSHPRISRLRPIVSLIMGVFLRVTATTNEATLSLPFTQIRQTRRTYPWSSTIHFVELPCLGRPSALLFLLEIFAHPSPDTECAVEFITHQK